MITSYKRLIRFISDLYADARLFVRSNNDNKKDLILMYHGIDKINSLQFNFRHVGSSYFEKHVKLIKKHYEVVTVPVFFSDQKFNKPKCCITFDDGYKNNLAYAVPILEKHNCPATIYITATNRYGKDFLWSDMLDLLVPSFGDSISLNNKIYLRVKKKWYQPFSTSEGENFHEDFKKLSYPEKCLFFESQQQRVDDIKKTADYEDYWKLLTDDEIKTIARSNVIEIGSHGIYHNNLGYIPLQQAKEELRLSKQYLETLIGKEVISIAYPDGSFSDEVVEEAEKIGYNYQLAVDYKASHHKNDPRIQDRIGIYAYESLFQQYSKILGE